MEILVRDSQNNQSETIQLPLTLAYLTQPETPSEWQAATNHRLARLFHELLSRDREYGRATGQSQGVGSEAYLNGTLQGSTPEDARKDGHIRGRSRRFVEYQG
jgi:hypothetical protein